MIQSQHNRHTRRCAGHPRKPAGRVPALGAKVTEPADASSQRPLRVRVPLSACLRRTPAFGAT